MAIPFWQRSLTALAYENVKAFVSLDLDEDEHIEYKAASSTLTVPKQDFDGKFCATVAAFANGGGGMILFGVTDGGPGRPREIVGEPPVNGKSRNPVQSVLDSCAARVEPTLLLQARAFTIPPGDPHEGSQILLVRVPAGIFPPYNVREHGIYIRGGKDGDRRAGVAEIERLFDVRSRLGPPEETLWSVAQRKVFMHLSANLGDYLPFLMVGLTPAFPIEPIAIDDSTDDRFQMLCWRIFPGYQGSLVAEPDGIAYAVASADRLIAEQPPYACVYADGSIGARSVFSYGKSWDAGRPEMVQLSITHMWKMLRGMVEALAPWPREQGAYDGPLTCRVAVGNLGGTVAVLPSATSGLRVLARDTPVTPSGLPGWQHRAEWERGVSIDDFLEPLVAKLARQLQYRLFRPHRERIRAESRG